MNNPMERQEIKEAFLAALDALDDDRKAANRALSEIAEITRRSHEITRRSHEIVEQGHEMARRSHEMVEQSHEITKQSHETTEQIREIANLASERLNAIDKQHETLIRLVKALDTGH